jgi:hypothetical protein
MYSEIMRIRPEDINLELVETSNEGQLMPPLSNDIVIKEIALQLIFSRELDVEKFSILTAISKGWHSNLNKLAGYYYKLYKEKKFFENNTLSAEETIEYIKENNFSIADLTKFKDLSQDLIEKLFQNYSNVHHLMINSDKIVRLPEECKELKTLDCSDCTCLTSLPAEWVALTSLNCSGCTGLTSLPAEFVALTYLDCSWCTGLAALPVNMPASALVTKTGCPALI